MFIIPSVSAILLVAVIYGWDVKNRTFQISPYFALIVGVVLFRFERGYVDWAFFFVLFAIVIAMHAGILWDKYRRK